MPRKTTYNDCLVLSGVVQRSRVATRRHIAKHFTQFLLTNVRTGINHDFVFKYGHSAVLHPFGSVGEAGFGQ